MQVYLLRHGTAEEVRSGMPDESRALTAEGRKKLRHVLRAALQANVEPSLIVSSPFKRALETAEIAKNIFGYKQSVQQSDALVPNSTPQQVWKEIRSHRQESSILLVGHNPLFSDLVPYLLNSPDLQIDFKKGALMRIDLERLSAQPAGILRWYLTAKLTFTNHKLRD